MYITKYEDRETVNRRLVLQSNAGGCVNARAGHRQQSEKAFDAIFPYLEVNAEVPRSLGLRVFGWLEEEAVQNLGLPIPGDHTFHLQIAKPSPSRSAQV